MNRIDVPKSPNQDPFPIGPDPKTWEGAWSSLNNPTDIAKHVCAANHRQYNQASVTPFGTAPLSTHLDYKADTVEAADLIHSRELPLHIKQQVLPETQAIFNTLHKLTTTHRQPVSSIITPDQLQSCYKAMDERTSSSPSGRHLGHYKAAILSPELTELHSVMMSIPLTAGFSP
jgi:hypothetical protein